jgi:hypothetical protein
LRIADLGYFSLAVFAMMAAAGEYFLSRLQFGTHVLLDPDEAVDVLPWLAKQPGPFVDVSILLGQEQRLPCRLIAWRLPRALANRRRRKLREELMDKKGREPTAERLAWCDWTILVTNVPGQLLTPPEAAVIQHWLLVGTVWGDPSRSLDKVWQAVQHFVGRLAVSLNCAAELERVLADMRATFAKTCRRDKRSKPGTFELLNDVELLDFELT